MTILGEIDEELRAEEVKELFRQTCWAFPVLSITDRHMQLDWNSNEFEAIELDEAYEFLIDTEKLDQIDDHSMGYVEHHLKAIANKLTVRDLMTRPLPTISLTGSRKYSFGDTPDWWNDALIENATGRIVIEVDIEST